MESIYDIIKRVSDSVPQHWSLKNIAKTKNNYSFLFQHIEDDIIYEEDRLVIITDKKGNILSSSITETPHELVAVGELQIRYAPQEEIIKRKIKKDMYYLYSGEPLEDFYNTTDIKKDDYTIRYLLDEGNNIIGQMIPPPFDGLSWSGCSNLLSSDRCVPWNRHCGSAYNYFSTCSDSAFLLKLPDYPTSEELNELKNSVLNIVHNEETKIYYGIAHGGYSSCGIRAGVPLYAINIRDQLEDREKMRFAFLGHCGAMVSTGEGTWCDAFSKSDDSECAIIGYYDMGSHLDAWRVSVEWQNYLLNQIDTKIPIYEAYENSLLKYPELVDASRFYGDETFTFLTIPISINSVEPTQTSYLPDENIEIIIEASTTETNRNGLINIYIDGTKLCEHYLYFQNTAETFTITLPPLENGTYNCCVYNEEEDIMICTTLTVTESVTIDSIEMGSISVNTSPSITVYTTNISGTATTQSVDVAREGVYVSSHELPFEDGETSKTFLIEDLPVETSVGLFNYCVDLS